MKSNTIWPLSSMHTQTYFAAKAVSCIHYPPRVSRGVIISTSSTESSCPFAGGDFSHDSCSGCRCTSSESINRLQYYYSDKTCHKHRQSTRLFSRSSWNIPLAVSYPMIIPDYSQWLTLTVSKRGIKPLPHHQHIEQPVDQNKTKSGEQAAIIGKLDGCTYRAFQFLYWMARVEELLLFKSSLLW